MTTRDKGAARFLDPDGRASGTAHGVVIALAELSVRTHELPPRDELILVLGPSPMATATVEWLRNHGRCAEVAERGLASGSSERTDSGELPARLWRPAEFLEQELDAIEAEISPRPINGAPRALELACGTGRDAVYLSRRGWDVTAVDALPDALSRARDLERRYGGREHPIAWLEIDLERPASGDLARRLQSESVRARDRDGDASGFDLIYVSRYLHRPLLTELPRLLRAGGRLVYETFTVRHRERHGKPARDAHVLRPNELIAALSGHEACRVCRRFVRHYSEAWRGVTHTARLHMIASAE